MFQACMGTLNPAGAFCDCFQFLYIHMLLFNWMNIRLRVIQNITEVLDQSVKASLDPAPLLCRRLEGISAIHLPTAENCWTRLRLRVCPDTASAKITTPLALPLHGWTKTRHLRAVTVSRFTEFCLRIVTFHGVIRNHSAPTPFQRGETRFQNMSI